jgi:hypothetical protein
VGPFFHAGTRQPQGEIDTKHVPATRGEINRYSHTGMRKKDRRKRQRKEAEMRKKIGGRDRDREKRQK